MLDLDDVKNGRKNTRKKRLLQSDTLKSIIQNRFGNDIDNQNFVVLGDLNDYLATDSQGQTGIDSLVCWNKVENVVDRLPEDQRWTHFYKGSNDIDAGYHQLDYILLSKKLANANSAAMPYIERRGMPKRADKYTGSRFSGVGINKPKASDHCLVMVEVEIKSK
jgi:predicted extracellular nuclease